MPYSRSDYVSISPNAVYLGAGPYCGKSTPPYFSSSWGSHAWVCFHSNDKVKGKGFEFTFECHGSTWSPWITSTTTTILRFQMKLQVGLNVRSGKFAKKHNKHANQNRYTI